MVKNRTDPKYEWKFNNKNDKNPIYMSTYSIMKNVWEFDVKDNLIFDTLISFGSSHLGSENFFGIVHPIFSFNII